MVTYIKINRYISGDTIRAQINALIEAKKIDEDTRLFFSKGNMLTMSDLADIAGYFDFVTDIEVDRDNLFLRPTKMLLSRIKQGRMLAER